MRICRVILLLFLARIVTAGTVWIDTDVSIGSPIREVDDAYALVLAFHSPEIRIAGISTTYGNAPLGHTHRTGRDLVRRFGRPAALEIDDVFAGADSPRDLKRPTRASEVLAATLRKRTLTYIALGPLTNLATFLEIHPKLADRIERVILIGGQTPGSTLAFGPNRSFHIHDANVFKDPAAVDVVLRSNIPLVLVPIEAASRLLIDAEDMREIESGGAAGKYLARRSRLWLWFWKSFVKTEGGPIFDACAILAVTRPRLLATEERYAAVDKSGNLIVRRSRTQAARTVRYCTKLAPGTKEFVVGRIVTLRSRD